ncbi:MAG: cytochrome P450 [Myxococcota bacterium]|nr:cytochrome P450 [Myxococcota bacterium]
MSQPLNYDPYSEEVIENPQAIYARLREEAPCYHLEKWDAYALSRFEDIWTASMDADHYTAAKGTTASHLLTKVQPVTPMINMMDPPEHTELRSKMAKHFTPGVVRKLVPEIQAIVDESWARVEGKDEVDLFNEFAAEVSVKVACLANGFPMEDADRLNALVWRFFGREEGVEGMTEDGLAAMNEMFGYFGELIMKRRGGEASTGSVVDLICTTEVGGKQLEVEAAASHLSMLIIGGSETFPKTFASAAHRLWQHAEQRAECVKDPSLIPGAYHEGLRYDMPTQFLMRVTTKPVSFHGVDIPADKPILFLYPSANRDPREFEDPDTFDIHRRPARILTFGHGIHACIGQHFAKMEGKLCFEKLLSEAPEYEVKEGELTRIRTEFVQGWESMPVVLNR